MDVWFLSVFMWVNGTWLPGHAVETGGWAPRPYESREICETRRDFSKRALEQSKAAGRPIIPTHWVCNEDKPLVEVPDDLAPPE
ncbi:MAG: hypothetical protein K8F25_17490 [Fimbriimonadaceae bacterium]|nr:hypothetical protein [Alphaproteobacteria bacterium]